MVKCSRCGITMEELKPRPYPTMYGFQLEDGRQINFCKLCIAELDEAICDGTTEEFFKPIREGAKHE